MNFRSEVNSQVLIVSSSFDAHVDAMIPKLNSMKQSVFRLNSDKFSTDNEIDIFIEKKSVNNSIVGHIRNSVTGYSLELDSIRSVWWRKPKGYGLPDYLSNQELNFASKEIRHTLSGVWNSLRCHWVSHPSSIREASYKPEQLLRARQIGFDIPDTIITKNLEQAMAFYDKHDGNIIYKVFSDPFLSLFDEGSVDSINDLQSFKRTLTTMVDYSQLTSCVKHQLSPCLFQELIQKECDIRVVVIGEEVFAVKIHSQLNEKTRYDWRHYDVEIPYTALNLPYDIEDKCRNFVHSYGLNFGAIDLVHTPEDNYVFLEINPNGQFLFIERRVPELKLMSVLATHLVRGTNSDHI